MARTVALPGPRDARGSLDTADGEADACVVACPPHPQLGGTRSDPRLRAVSAALGRRGIACLRFDYGPWDDGRREQVDAGAALEWAGAEYRTAGLFGYSFGGGVALCAAADADASPAAVSTLAPPATLVEEGDVVAALDAIAGPVQVLVGEHDGTVESGPVAERARALGETVEMLPGDHHFTGQHDRVGRVVAAFVDASLPGGR